MFWYVIFGFFAAAGALFLLWLVLGAFLPVSRKCAVFVRCDPGEELPVIRHYWWLRNLGLVRCDLIILDSDQPEQVQAERMEKYAGVRFASSPQWQQERGSDQYGGTGTGDSAGQHRGSGVSEL